MLQKRLTPSQAIFFDLFFTLIIPKYYNRTEYDILNITEQEWEKYAEDEYLYRERALGNVQSEKEIIDNIVDTMPYYVNKTKRKEILELREKRMRKSLLDVDDTILSTLKKIHENGIKVGLISNADRIDSKYWEESNLSKLFDIAVFSCDVGILKPDIDIYKLAMKKLNVQLEKCIFVGDGGSNELYGARRAGMKTVYTEYLDYKQKKQREIILKYADYHIYKFNELLNYINL